MTAMGIMADEGKSTMDASDLDLALMVGATVDGSNVGSEVGKVVGQIETLGSDVGE